MNKLSEEIVQASFLNEMEKQAGWGETIVKVLRKADLIAGEGGAKAGLEYLAQHRSPLFAISKGALKQPVKVNTYGKAVGKAERFVMEELGNTANALHGLTKGVSKDNSLTKNVGTLVKNFGTVNMDQIRASRYKIIPKEKAVFPITNKGSKIQGRGALKHFKFFDRKVEGMTNTGDFLVKKRKGMVPLSMAITPVGFGAADLALGSGKNDTPARRVGSAVKETALWSLTPPVAQVKLISDMLK